MQEKQNILKDSVTSSILSQDDYLDQELGYLNGHVSDELMRLKKQEYRKLYMFYFREKYYDKMAQITLQFPKKELEVHRKQSESLRMKLSVYIKSFIKNNHNLDTMKMKASITPMLLEITDLVEECLNEGNIKGLREALGLLEIVHNKLI